MAREIELAEYIVERIKQAGVKQVIFLLAS